MDIKPKNSAAANIATQPPTKPLTAKEFKVALKATIQSPRSGWLRLDAIQAFKDVTKSMSTALDKAVKAEEGGIEDAVLESVHEIEKDGHVAYASVYSADIPESGASTFVLVFDKAGKTFGLP